MGFFVILAALGVGVARNG